MKEIENNALRHRVLLSTYKAMLGMIHPGIRVITIDWGISYYVIKAIFDRPVSDDDLDLLKVITTEVAADFSEMNSFQELAEYSLEPVHKLDPLREMVFLRYGELQL